MKNDESVGTATDPAPQQRIWMCLSSRMEASISPGSWLFRVALTTSFLVLCSWVSSSTYEPTSERVAVRKPKFELNSIPAGGPRKALIWAAATNSTLWSSDMRQRYRMGFNVCKFLVVP